jgi:hypothetical protein
MATASDLRNPHTARLRRVVFEWTTKLKGFAASVGNPIGELLPEPVGLNYFTRLYRRGVSAPNVARPKDRAVWIPRRNDGIN